MTTRQPRDLAASVRQRLMNLSRERGEDFQLVLTRYGLERLLYRVRDSRGNEGCWQNDKGDPAAAKNLRFQSPPDPPLGLTALFAAHV